MRILYLSCHSVLEFDEVTMLSAIGHYVFSTGAYVEPRNPGDPSMRPGLAGIQYDAEDSRLYAKLTENARGGDAKENLTREFVDRFDVVIVMHIPHWIINNWNVFLGKRVIWRTIGQSIYNNEKELAPFRDKGLNIVRYSPKERTIPGYIGEDAMIRFYKDPNEFRGWNGDSRHVVTFNQSLAERGTACNYPFYEQVMKDMPAKLYGPGNAGIVQWQGKADFHQLKAEMRNNRCYFYVGTHPASYTLNFIEAWMTGIPMVCVGPKRGNAEYFPGHLLYEVSDLIENGKTGFCTDNVDKARAYINLLFDDRALADSVSTAGRGAAIEHFGKDKIFSQWKAYLETL